MTPWQWWVGLAEDVECEGSYGLGPYATRAAAVAAGLREWPDQTIVVIEARSSTAAKHYIDPDRIPFLHSRNRAEIEPDYRVLAQRHLQRRAAYWLDRAAKETPPRWWQWWKPDRQADFASLASEMDLLADELLELGVPV